MGIKPDEAPMGPVPRPDEHPGAVLSAERQRQVLDSIEAEYDQGRKRVLPSGRTHGLGSNV
eukprot:365226-Chlamydomonas_euryale.AAC.8